MCHALENQATSCLLYTSKEDIFVEVSDEIVEAFLLDKRAEAARERKMFRYKAFYSLDCNDGIENAAIGTIEQACEGSRFAPCLLYTSRCV